MRAHVETSDDAVALGRVHARGERQRWHVLAAREFHLRQIVDEEIQFGRHAAQARLDQPNAHPHTHTHTYSKFTLESVVQSCLMY